MLMLARLKVIRSIVFGEPNTQAKTHIAKNNGVLALNVIRHCGAAVVQVSNHSRGVESKTVWHAAIF
jgi:hypothetical protein